MINLNIYTAAVYNGVKLLILNPIMKRIIKNCYMDIVVIILF